MNDKRMLAIKIYMIYRESGLMPYEVVEHLESILKMAKDSLVETLERFDMSEEQLRELVAKEQEKPDDTT